MLQSWDINMKKVRGPSWDWSKVLSPLWEEPFHLRVHLQYCMAAFWRNILQKARCIFYLDLLFSFKIWNNESFSIFSSSHVTVADLVNFPLMFDTFKECLHAIVISTLWCAVLNNYGLVIIDCITINTLVLVIGETMKSY